MIKTILRLINKSFALKFNLMSRAYNIRNLSSLLHYRFDENLHAINKPRKRVFQNILAAIFVPVFYRSNSNDPLNPVYLDHFITGEKSHIK